MTSTPNLATDPPPIKTNIPNVQNAQTIATAEVMRVVASENKRAYYNEFDPKAAAWLRELIKRNLIAPGDVDERSICNVRPEDLRGYTQCHFFAGIGGWSLALRLAGWPDDRPVWTGSCPCQPFSKGNCGEEKGTGDPRDLWPVFFGLIREQCFVPLFGEQVDDAIEWGWLDRLGMSLESEDFAVGSAVLPSASAGANHLRKRLFFCAIPNSKRAGREGYKPLTCIPLAKETALAKYGDPFVRARRAMAGDWGDLLFGDGLPVAMARSCVHGYGNAIVPQIAAEFIEASAEAAMETRGAA